MAEVYPKVNSLIAHLPEVRAAVAVEADARAVVARALLAPHTKSGKTEVTVQHRRVDSLVSLENPKGEIAVLSIEFGWHDGDAHADGLHILGRAFGI